MQEKQEKTTSIKIAKHAFGSHGAYVVKTYASKLLYIVIALAITTLSFAAMVGLSNSGIFGNQKTSSESGFMDQAFAQTPNPPSAVKSDTIKVACVGDSITQGVRGVTYVDTLRQLLGKSYDVQNFGVSGSTALEESWLPYKSTPAYQQSLKSDADIVVIMLGTNDAEAITSDWKGTFASDYASLVNDYLSLPSQPQVYLCTISARYQVNDYESAHVVTSRYIRHGILMSEIKRIADQNMLEVIDVNTATSNHPEWYSIDGVHPGQDGANQIAQTVFEALQARDSQ